MIYPTAPGSGGRRITLPDHRTKIVSTIGPASRSREVLVRMIQAGMNVARLNLAHGTFEEHRENIRNIRVASEETGLPVTILIDLPGPKMGWNPQRAHDPPEGRERSWCPPLHQTIL